jgi:winged helix-turn-helix protein
MEASNGNPAEPTVSAPEVEPYEPKFDRLGTHRRVLGHVTDEDHVGRGPRNTAARLNQELAEDPYTEFDRDDDVQEYLDDLEANGLISQQEGTYKVTEAGQYELMH